MLINVYCKILLGTSNEIYEITHMFNEMHEIGQILDWGSPDLMEENTTGNFKTPEMLKLKEFPILS